MHLVESPVTDPDAHLLLTHYFTSRELDFPRRLGTYRVTYPTPAQFVPPAGVFLVARGGSADAPGARAWAAPGERDAPDTRESPTAERDAPGPRESPAAERDAPGEQGVPLGCGGIRLLPEADRARLPGPAAAATDRSKTATSAPVYEIKHVWLEPEARGQGWAGILMSALEDRARAFGADTVVLDTNASLTGAAKLYARRGYESIPPYNDNPNATNWYRKTLD